LDLDRADQKFVLSSFCSGFSDANFESAFAGLHADRSPFEH